MRASPAFQAAIGLVQAGIDHRPFLREPDPLIRLADVVVANGANELWLKNAERRDKNLAADIGGRVGSMVGRSLSSALQAISRAMRG